VKKLIP